MIERKSDTGMNLIMAPPADPRFLGTLEKAIETEIKHGRHKLDPNNDMGRKRLRRLVSNRLSAQRSREKKTQHILDMEKLLEDLQVFISVVAPKVHGYKDKANLLMIENHYLLTEVEKLSYESKLQEKELERLKNEVIKLKELENGLNKHKYETSSGGLRDYNQNLSVYQDGNMNFTKHGTHNRLDSRLDSCGLQVASVSGIENFNKDELSSFRIKQAHEISELDKKQEETDIGQYLNIDAVTADLSNSST